MKALFVTATGTGIGKTFVTAALTHQARARGVSVRAFKPVATGFDAEPLAASDSAVLLRAMGHALTDERLDWVSPLRYGAPLAPSMAAAREGKRFRAGALIAHSKAALAGPEDLLLVEGVGGVMVPLDGRETVRDWIAALDIPALLVAGSYLGTLSHTLSAIEALRGRRVALAGVVVSETPGSSVPLDDTVEALRVFAERAPVLALPRAEDWTRARDLTSVLA